MLSGLVIFVHVIVCILLAAMILVQSGKGGGLTEQFAPAGDVFGTQASSFLVKGTTILATLFLITCLSLAVLSSKKERSLMANKVAAPVAASAPVVTPAVNQNVEPVVDDSTQNIQETPSSTEAVEVLPNQPLNAD